MAKKHKQALKVAVDLPAARRLRRDHLKSYNAKVLRLKKKMKDALWHIRAITEEYEIRMEHTNKLILSLEQVKHKAELTKYESFTEMIDLWKKEDWKNEWAVMKAALLAEEVKKEK